MDEMENTNMHANGAIDLSLLSDEAKRILLQQLKNELEPAVSPKDEEIIAVVTQIRKIAADKKCRVSVVAFTVLTALRLRAKIGEGVAEAIDTGTGEITPIQTDKRSKKK